MKRISKRRRREGKTDYKARLVLLKSELPRVVFRKTNKYVIGQYIKSKEARDSVIIGVNSKDLLKLGWKYPGSLKSIPASYLTGFLLGKKIIDRDEKVKAIFDLGLLRNTKGSRIYAFLKGVIDAGVEIKVKEEMFPSEERIKGMHMKKDISSIFEKIKEKIEND